MLCTLAPLLLTLGTPAPADAHLARAIIKAAAQALPLDTRVLAVERLQVPRDLPRPPYRLTVITLSHKLLGRVPARVIVQNATSERELMVVLRVVVDRSVVRLLHNVAAGQVLTAADLLAERDTQTEDGPALIAATDDAVGKRARFAMKAGERLQTRALEAQPLFLARHKLRLVVRAAGASVSAPAEAQEAGAPGGSVRVLNLLSNHMVLAHVVDSDTVEVTP